MAGPGPWIFTNTAMQKILNDTFNLSTDSFKMALLTSSSNIGVTSTAFASVTGEVGTSGTGYTAGGLAVTFTIANVTTNDALLTLTTNPSWTAGASGLVYRTQCIYEVGGDVLCYSLADSTPADVTIPSGQPLTIDSDGSPSPILTLNI